MKKIIKKRAGFTLVELLIVIIIIGILAGSMMLVAGSGTDKAEATKIVSNLRSLKAATLLYYADEAGKGTDVTAPTGTVLDKYMDRKLADLNGYTIVSTTTGSGVAAVTNWYSQYTFPTSFSAGAKSKLIDMSGADGLYGSTEGAALATNSTVVVMKAR